MTRTFRELPALMAILVVPSLPLETTVRRSFAHDSPTNSANKTRRTSYVLRPPAVDVRAQPAPILNTQSSRGVEGPGPLMLRQPTERHGGNARFDEETIMVSKALASLDAWLALAEEVLGEPDRRPEQRSDPDVPSTERPVQLRFDLGHPR